MRNKANLFSTDAVNSTHYKYNSAKSISTAAVEHSATVGERQPNTPGCFHTEGFPVTGK